MIRPLLAVLVLVLASVAHAQGGATDDVLRAVDELMSERRCDAALALLEHARGTPAELAGRRGICEAALGRSQDAAAHVAEALRASSDPWVVANRARLLAALSAPAPVQAPTVSQFQSETSDGLVPYTPPVDDGSAVGEPQSAPPERAHVRIDEGFVAHFGGEEPPPDRPLERLRPTIAGGRLFVRPLVAFGLVARFAPWFGDSPYRAPRYDVGQGVGGTRYDFSIGSLNERFVASPRLDIGAELENVLTRRVSLVAALELGLFGNGLEDADVVTTTVLAPPTSSNEGRYDRSKGAVEWSPAFSLRATFLSRIYVGRRWLLGFGARVGFVRVLGRADLEDVGDADDYYYSDDDSRAAGTPEGTFRRWAGGATVESVFDVGLTLGEAHDSYLLLRISNGTPTLTTQLVFAMPIYRSQP